MPRALIFDFDGVMVDSETPIARAVVEILAERGHHTDLAAIGHLFGATGPDADKEWEDALTGWLGTPVGVPDIEAEIERRLERSRRDLPLMPGVGELITAAKGAGWLIGLATGKRRASLEVELRRLGVADAFDVVMTSAEVARPKPFPDVYLEVARQLGVAPEECVVVEDSLPGCRAAQAAGMLVLACPSEVTAACPFPDGAVPIACLTDLTIETLDDLAPAPRRATRSRGEDL